MLEFVDTHVPLRCLAPSLRNGGTGKVLATNRDDRRTNTNLLGCDDDLDALFTWLSHRLHPILPSRKREAAA